MSVSKSFNSQYQSYLSTGPFSVYHAVQAPLPVSHNLAQIDKPFVCLLSLNALSYPYPTVWLVRSF